jgi:hypothetical protein
MPGRLWIRRESESSRVGYCTGRMHVVYAPWPDTTSQPRKTAFSQVKKDGNVTFQENLPATGGNGAQPSDFKTRGAQHET